VKRLISILIPCYNAEGWVAQAIESALAQTWPEKEVVVVDDGSTDDSLEIIKRFGDRISWETGPNRGGNRARNRLLALAQGEWLQYVDADDYLLPDKVASQMEFLTAHPEIDIVFSRMIQETHSDTGVEQGVSRLPQPHDPWALLVRWDLGQTGALLWRKKAIEKVGGWKADQPCCQEHELYLRLLKAGQRFSYCPHVGAVYRQWKNGSVCTKDPKETNRRRLGIIAQAEQFLREHNELNSDRRWAISHARLELARSAWRYDKQFAIETAKALQESHSEFNPGGPGARIQYGLGYKAGFRLFGFAGAERIADWMRR